MNNYSKVLTFFMGNGVQLNKEQIEALKEEFLTETVADDWFKARKLWIQSIDGSNYLKNNYPEAYSKIDKINKWSDTGKGVTEELEENVEILFIRK